MAKLLLFLALALFLVSSMVSAHGDHNFDSYAPYKEKVNSYDSIKREYTSPDGREKTVVTERTRYKSSMPGVNTYTKTTSVKKTSVNYPVYYESAPLTHYRYQKAYNYHDYGPDQYGKAYYYDPAYHYNGYYDWRY